MIGILVGFIIIIVGILISATLFIFKIEKQTKKTIITCIQDILNSKGLDYNKLLYINKYLSIAFLKDKIALIENFNPNNPTNYNFKLIPNSFIKHIENSKINLKISYLKGGKLDAFYINPISKEALQLFYEIYKNNCLKTLQKHFEQDNFNLTSGCDWNCSYFWAYNSYNNNFAYYKTTGESALGKVNLRKKFFTIDLKYSYFEAPVLGIAQHLSIYEDDFLENVFISIFNSIKEKTAEIAQDILYFDNHENIIYLINNGNSIQSILIDKIEDIIIKNNRLTFKLKDSDKSINFNANPEIIKELDDFIINLNLKKIANSFDYSVDRLINATDFTKFIIDFSRDRIIYCANLNSLSKFSYLTISFDNLEDAKAEKTSNKSFVRIFSKDKEIIDVSCNKFEVAQYIMAQIKQITQ